MSNLLCTDKRSERIGTPIQCVPAHSVKAHDVAPIVDCLRNDVVSSGVIDLSDGSRAKHEAVRYAVGPTNQPTIAPSWLIPRTPFPLPIPMGVRTPLASRNPLAPSAFAALHAFRALLTGGWTEIFGSQVLSMRDLKDKIRSLPQVNAAASIHFLPLTGIGSGSDVYRADRPKPRSAGRFLERDPLWQPRPALNAPDRLFRKKVQELLNAVDKRYARLITDDLYRKSRGPNRWSGFTREFLIRVADHVQKGLPLAFPAPLAEAYLRNPLAGHAAACRGCGYHLPPLCFQLCPVCGKPVER